MCGATDVFSGLIKSHVCWSWTTPTQCRLHDAIQVLEGLIRTDPTCFLTERMALNLCTLYELSADTTVANRKKRTLQLIAKRFFLHDVGPESFRIGP